MAKGEGKGCLCLRGQGARAGPRGVWRQLLPSPLTTRPYFFPLEKGKCVDKVWKNHIFHPSPSASKLSDNGCKSRGWGASGGTGRVLRQVPCPSSGTPPGWASPPFSPMQAPSRLWIAGIDLGRGWQGSELALAGIAGMSDYVCLCLCNVWYFPALCPQDAGRLFLQS